MWLKEDSTARAILLTQSLRKRDDECGVRRYDSSTMVTAPSFTSVTSIRAPKTPRVTRTP